MLILGIVMKHDDKMTGEYVYNVYALLYFKGVNFTDIVEAMYLVFIIVGTLSVILSLLMLSDIFKTLQYKWKNKGVSIYCDDRNTGTDFLSHFRIKQILCTFFFIL